MKDEKCTNLVLMCLLMHICDLVLSIYSYKKKLFKRDIANQLQATIACKQAEGRMIF